MKLHAPSNFDYFFSKIYPLSNYKLFNTSFDLTKMMMSAQDYTTENVRFTNIGNYQTASFVPNLGPAATIFLLMVFFIPLMHVLTTKLMRSFP